MDPLQQGQFQKRRAIKFVLQEILRVDKIDGPIHDARRITYRVIFGWPEVQDREVIERTHEGGIQGGEKYGTGAVNEWH